MDRQFAKLHLPVEFVNITITGMYVSKIPTRQHVACEKAQALWMMTTT